MVDVSVWRPCDNFICLSTDSLFINNYNSKDAADTIVEAIQTCQDSLQCFSLVESAFAPNVSKCCLLKGFLISQVDANGVQDEHFANLLKALPALKRLYVEGGQFVEKESWADLQKKCYLEVLWIDVTKCIDGRHDMVRGDVQTARQTLRASKAKLLMVNPDEKINSHFVAGQTKDRLNGKKVKTWDQVMADMVLIRPLPMTLRSKVLSCFSRPKWRTCRD